MYYIPEEETSQRDAGREVNAYVRIPYVVAASGMFVRAVHAPAPNCHVYLARWLPGLVGPQRCYLIRPTRQRATPHLRQTAPLVLPG